MPEPLANQKLIEIQYPPAKTYISILVYYPRMSRAE
jgi:hypothetical protein